MATKTPIPTAPATRTRRPRQPLPPVSPEALRLITMGVGLLRSCVATPALDGEAVARKAHYALAGISLAMTEDPALRRGLRRQNRRDKGTIDLILALGHAVPGTIRDWVRGPDRHQASSATSSASAEAPATVPTSDADEVEARELFLEMRRAAACPGSVEALQAYANSQQGAADYACCHWLAACVGALAAGTSPPARATYQAPPRPRPELAGALPAIPTVETDAVAPELALLTDTDRGGYPSTLAREKMFTRLGIAIERASTRPDCVERARELADGQADDALYKLGHYLAELLTEIRVGTFQGPEWLTYQAPPRTRPAQGAAAPTIASAGPRKEITP